MRPFAITFRLSLLFTIAAAIGLSGCGGPGSADPELGMTKEQAQASESWTVDYCEEWGWYGDGICDDWCPEPDPDCEPSHPTDHRPYCGAIGSRSEGWYWGDSGELIKFERCAQASDPQCGAIGSRSEGWSTDAGLIVWDGCHQTVGLSLFGEACAGDSELACYSTASLDPDGLYCRGDAEGRAGTCSDVGSCVTGNDCLDEGNVWVHPMCMGRAVCEAGRCVWNCDAEPMGPWSWTTHLVAGVESEHPYTNNFGHTWDIEKPGAEKIKVQLQKVDIEAGYDSLVVTGDREEIAQLFDGQQEHVWTREFGGDTIHLALQTDYSVTGWGFKVASVSYYEQLPLGTCNVTADCGPGEFCHPHRCFSPYGPCHGSCLPEEPGMTRTFTSDEALAIPDNVPAGVTSELDVDEPFACQPEVKVDVTLRHSYAGDLRLTLRDPDGASVVLWDRQGGGQDDVVLSGFDVSGQVALQQANGIWKLDVSDHAAYDEGTLESWTLRIRCQ